MDECCIALYDSDYEHPFLYKVKTVIARKTHRCVECRGDIVKGESYESVSAVYDGEWYHFKTCRICVRIRDDIYCDGYIHGDLRDDVWEVMGIDIRTGEMRDDEPDPPPLSRLEPDEEPWGGSVTMGGGK
jgi:hypothetical protein